VQPIVCPCPPREPHHLPSALDGRQMPYRQVATSHPANDRHGNCRNERTPKDVSQPHADTLATGSRTSGVQPRHRCRHSERDCGARREVECHRATDADSRSNPLMCHAPVGILSRRVLRDLEPLQPTSRSSLLRSLISSRRRAAYSNRRSAEASAISVSRVWIKRCSSSPGMSARPSTKRR
jgi:hypothetical protein